MARYRRRARRSRRVRRRSTRRVARRRIGLKKSTVIVGWYHADSANLAFVLPSSNTIGAFTVTNEFVQMYNGSSVPVTALVYYVRPILGQLVAGAYGDMAYATYANIYDQVRVMRCGFVFRPPFGMRSALQVSVGSDTTNPTMLNLPNPSPDVTFLDLDASTLLPVTLSTTGDYTGSCSSRYASRAHAFGKSIKRFWRPSGLTTTYDGASASFIAQQSIRPGWLRSNVSSQYFGDCGVAISYKGNSISSASTLDQPLLRYSVQTWFKIAMRMPLYG